MDKPADIRSRPVLLPGASASARVFRLKAQDDRLFEVELRNLEWGVLFAVTGEHTVAEIGELFRLEPALRDQVFNRLCGLGLIEERPLDYAGLLRALATVRDDAPKSLASFLRQGAAWGKGPAAGKPAAPPAAVARAVPVALPGRPLPLAASILDEATITRAVPTVPAGGLPPELTFQPLSLGKEPGSGGSARRLSLKALIQTVLDRAHDRSSGQLDVYRVFIRVPTRLLKRNGITTLRFHDDHLIDDPELQQALESSLTATLGVACPPSVYVAAS